MEKSSLLRDGAGCETPPYLCFLRIPNIPSKGPFEEKNVNPGSPSEQLETLPPPKVKSKGSKK